MNADFPRIITLIRKEKKLSQKQAAADLGVSQALLSHYEKGIRECGLDFLVRAADYYGVSCDYLLGRSASPQSCVTSSPCISENSDEREKMISDSEKIILKLCDKSDISGNASEYINACLYKLLRIIYDSNPENDKGAFRVSDAESQYLSDSIISKECAGIKKKCSKDKIRITVSELSENFPDSHSLLSLIKLTEDKLTAL